MAKRRFFNSLESQAIQKDKDRRRNYANYHTKRAQILADLQPEIDRISAQSKLAEALAAKIISAPTTGDKEQDGRFLITEEEIREKMRRHKML